MHPGRPVATSEGAVRLTWDKGSNSLGNRITILRVCGESTSKGMRCRQRTEFYNREGRLVTALLASWAEGSMARRRPSCACHCSESENCSATYGFPASPGRQNQQVLADRAGIPCWAATGAAVRYTIITPKIIDSWAKALNAASSMCSSRILPEDGNS